MITFLIVWYLIGVILIWISEWRLGNVKRLKTLTDILYAVGISLLSWIVIVWFILNLKDY